MPKPKPVPSPPPRGGRLLTPATALKIGPPTIHSPNRWLRTAWPAGGWLGPGPWRMQRDDQGQDLETALHRHVCAPGWGKCVAHLHDGPFPNGFGSPYAVVWIGSGRFANRLWYLGHANHDVVPVGTTFHTGHPLARLDHFLNDGWGWVEIGEAPGGLPAPMGHGRHLRHLFATPLYRWHRA